MSSFFSGKNTQHILNSLLNVYERVMVLKVFVDSNDYELKNKYFLSSENHNNKLLNNPFHIDAGFDLFSPGSLSSDNKLLNNSLHNNTIVDLLSSAKEHEETNKLDDILTFYGPGYDSNISPVNKLDMKVCCSARMYLDSGKNFNTGYYMYPRSSLSKTQLRLSNSTGIIDAGYRGHLTGMFDVVNTLPYANNICYGKKYDRYLQICAPGLVPIIVEIVHNIDELGEETERGSGGFGSTGR